MKPTPKVKKRIDNQEDISGYLSYVQTAVTALADTIDLLYPKAPDYDTGSDQDNDQGQNNRVKEITKGLKEMIQGQKQSRVNRTRTKVDSNLHNKDKPRIKATTRCSE